MMDCYCELSLSRIDDSSVAKLLALLIHQRFDQELCLVAESVELRESSCGLDPMVGLPDRQQHDLTVVDTPPDSGMELPNSRCRISEREVEDRMSAVRRVKKNFGVETVS